jgi:hypothetical protein
LAQRSRVIMRRFLRIWTLISEGFLSIDSPLCHPDRSEAERRDLQFFSSAGSARRVKLQIPPLRFAPVGMTKGRVVPK